MADVSASSTKLKEPSFLLAASNTRKMIHNLEHLLELSALAALRSELDRNVALLFKLGEDHLAYATEATRGGHWRQSISRSYYAAYNVRRAVALHFDGNFATDISDHKEVSKIPTGFPDAATHANHLGVLRDDRNLADYSHLAEEADLVFSPRQALANAIAFRDAAKTYLAGRGVSL
jgi:hypothetical protein